MRFFVPASLREAASTWGEKGTDWLESLPPRIAELERAWALTAGRPFEAGTCAWVAPVQLADGSEAVLKVSFPSSEARYEADALRSFDGRGAVILLRASDDGCALLLERCIPGKDLWSVGVEEGNAVGAEILQRLWREPPSGVPIENLSDVARSWVESLPREFLAAGYDSALVARVVEQAHELASTDSRSVLLHGDFHPGNVLSSTREPWLAIDPKPLAGDPAYDLAQWIGNRCEAVARESDPVAAIRWQADRLSDLLGLDPDRVAGWAFVKSLGWNWGAPTMRLLYEALAT